jgi:hypothetical protein
MTISRTQNSEDQSKLRISPLLGFAVAARLTNSVPRRFTFFAGALSFLGGFTYLKLNDIFRRHTSENKKGISLAKSSIKQFIKARIETKPTATVQADSETKPIMTKNKTARTWAERREQLLKAKPN